jgi:glycosyltransferase involved in cell wall biosynthesis
MSPDCMRRIRLRTCALASCCVILALLTGQLLGRRAQPHTPSAQSVSVCIASADPMLVPASRGTAEALWNLAHELDRHGVSVHIILIAELYETCVRSMHKIMFVAGSIRTSCAHTGEGNSLPRESAAFMYRPRSSLLRHFREHALSCTLLISHEWWTPLQDLLTERYLHLDDGSLPQSVIVNVHGGAKWSSSWSNASGARYVDVVEDADERVGALLADSAVFPSEYMLQYHTTVWALPATRRVIPNVVLDLETRAPAGTDLIGFSSLAFVGSVEERKGIDALLAVLKSITEFPVIELHIFGVSGMVNAVPADAYIVQALRGMPHVNCTLHGAVSATHLWTSLKARNSLIVMPTLLENQPMTIINAYQYRVPVLCYDVGGVSAMLTPESRLHVLVPPLQPQLRSRLAKMLRTQQAAVPVLHETMFDAVPAWLKLVDHHLGAPRKAVRRLTRLRVDQSFTSVVVTDTLGTDELATLLASCNTSVVLLARAPYTILQAAEDTLHALAQYLSSQAPSHSGVAGIVGLVRLRDTTLFPNAPFFLPSRNWLSCGPEVPLLVHRGILSAFATAFPHVIFRQWLFTLWLFYRPLDRLVVLRAPIFLFEHSGFVDPLTCFQTNQVMLKRPEAMAANIHALSEMAVPAPAAQLKRTHLRDHFKSLILDSCQEVIRVRQDKVWLRAVAEPEPRLCNASTEHGLFTLHALKTSLLHSCGAYCVYPMGDTPPPPATYFAWGLDTVHNCWQEVSSIHSCVSWFAGRARTFPGALPVPASPPPRPARTGAGRPTCGFELAAAQHPPGGFCGPRVVLAHFSSCARGGENHNGLSQLVEAPVENADGLLQARLRYAQSRSQMPAAASEVDNLLLDHNLRMDAAARLKLVLPDARVAVFVCDTTQRAWREFQAIARDDDAIEALIFLNVSTFADAVAVLSPTSPACAYADSMSHERFTHCLHLQRRLLDSGQYASHLYSWFAAFGKHNVLVLDADAALPVNARRVSEFVSLEPPPNLAFTTMLASTSDFDGDAATAANVQTQLCTLFDEHNSWLARLIGDTFTYRWTKSAAAAT